MDEEYYYDSGFGDGSYGGDFGISEFLPDSSGAGFDFADALHHASYVACSRVASFDDRRFARRALRLGLAPTVDVPS